MTKGKATESKRRIAWGRYLLICFVAAWMFVLGVLVGRGTAPVHFDTQALQKELAGLRDAMMQKEREAVEKAMRGEDEQAPLEFYEALKSDAPDTAVDILAAPVAKDDAGVPATSVETKARHRKTRATIMAKKARVPVKAATVSPPLPRVPVPVQGQLTIQLASMKDGTAAERFVESLKKDGYPAYLSRIVIPDKGLWFRVRVGSYINREQAAPDLERLIQSQKKPILVKQ